MDDLFHAFTRDLIELELCWTDERERSGAHYAVADARHHLAHAICDLEDASGYDTLSEGGRVLVREAFMSVLTIGQLVQRAIDERWGHLEALAHVHTGVRRTLDALTPYVSRADAALRRTQLDGIALETVLAEMRGAE